MANTYMFHMWTRRRCHARTDTPCLLYTSYWAIRNAMPDTVKADLAYNNAYWAQFQDSVVQTVSNQVYDGLLKAYGDERGIQSYGTVVDLLVAYYRDLAQEKP